MELDEGEMKSGMEVYTNNGDTTNNYIAEIKVIQTTPEISRDNSSANYDTLSQLALIIADFNGITTVRRGHRTPSSTNSY
jgi:hypothetical protein